MRTPQLTALFTLSALACTAPEPAPHALRITQESPCGSCSVVQQAEGLAFETDDGQLALFADYQLGPSRVAMLELSGVSMEGSAFEIRYHEVEGGQVIFDGEIIEPRYELRRITPDEALMIGSLSFEGVAKNGDSRRFENIEVTPPHQVWGQTDPSYSGGGSSGGGGGGSTTVVVVGGPHYHVHDGGCGGTSDYGSGGGGCEGDSSAYDSGGGCEGDTASDAGGGCEGDTASSCEGDYAATPQSAAVAGLWRLGWPILTVGLWNRNARRRRGS